MTILNINKYYFIRGGAERFFFDLGELLHKKGHKIVPFAMHHKQNLESEFSKFFVSEVQTDKISFGWQGFRTIGRFFWSFEATHKLKKIIKKEKPEFTIVHNIYHQISPSILPVLRKNKIPVVLVAHDYALLSPNYTMFANGKIYDKICGNHFLKCILDKCVKGSFFASLICSLEMWFHHSVLKVYKKNIDLVICPSEFMYKKFVQAGWIEKRLIHLPYFINLDSSTSVGMTEEKTGTKEKKNYILYLGRLSEEKGIDVLIKAMQKLPDIKLKIVGTGPELENYKLQIINYKLQNIELLGYKSGEELNKIIREANCVVVPSIWYEVTGLVILEAYLNGTPVIASDIGGIREVVKDKETGYLFQVGNSNDLADKIKLIFKNYELQKIMACSGRKLISENHNSEKYYQKLMEVYKNLSK